MQRILILLIVAASLLAGTFYMGYKQGAGKVVTVTNTVKGDTQVVFKDRIVTRTKVVQKDGTVTEVTRTEEKQQETSSHTSDTSVAVTPAKTKYSLGLMTAPKLVREDGHIKSIRIMPGLTAGYNLGNDVWVKLGYVPNDSLVVVGIEVHF